jgi:hypothetical protein
MTKTYSITTPEEMAAKVKAAGGPEIDPTKPEGQVSADGVTLGYMISARSVAVTLLKKPFYVPEATIWGHLDAFFGGTT